MNFDLETYILSHVQNSSHWHIPFLPSIHLPAFLTVHTLMMFICVGLLILIFGLLYKKSTDAPQGLTNLLELFILFIRDDVAAPAMGKEEGRKLTPLLCTFFFFILLMNLLGMIPGFSTATGNINITAGLALVTLTFMIGGGIYFNGVGGFLKSFVPPHVPIPVLIILTPVEFLGMFIKAIALTIRLFANMLAGHIIIFSILGLVVLLGMYALPAVFLAVFISVLEVFVAFLQAYVFTLLSAMFIGQSLHPQH